MTKLEQKLVELGYEFFGWNVKIKMYEKRIKYTIINICTKEDKLLYKYCEPINKHIKSQQDIDNLQQAFNQLQKDLEVLKEYERLD